MPKTEARELGNVRFGRDALAEIQRQKRLQAFLQAVSVQRVSVHLSKKKKIVPNERQTHK